MWPVRPCAAWIIARPPLSDPTGDDVRSRFSRYPSDRQPAGAFSGETRLRDREHPAYRRNQTGAVRLP